MTPQSIQDEKITGLLNDAQTDRHESHADLEKQLSSMQGRITAVESSLAANTLITRNIQDDTIELLDIIRSVKGGFKVMGWMGVLAKWVASLLAVFGAIYAFVQNIKGH